MLRRVEILLIVACTVITLGLLANDRRIATTAANGEFQRISEDGVKALSSRMSTYLQSLNGAAAFLNASDMVSASDLDSFVETLDIGTFLPGINGIGFITPVERGQEGALRRDLAAQGIKNLTIHPDTESQTRFIISQISPRGPNIEALGLDITFEKGRREAAERARDTGKPQLTPRILLVQDETKQPGFLLLRPLNMAARSEGADAGSDRFRGWVYAPFVGKNLLTNLTPNQGRDFNIQVFDGSILDRDKLIFENEPAEMKAGGFAAIYKVDLYGREWTVAYESTPVFDRLWTNTNRLLIMAGGIMVTGLLLFALRTLQARSIALSEVAALRAREITAREDENKSIAENSVTAVFILDENNMVLFANEAALISFGYLKEQMNGMSFDSFITDVTSGDVQLRYSATGKTHAGQELKLDIQRNTWSTPEDLRRVTAVVRDITAEVEAIDQVEATKRRFDLALEGAQIGVFEIDLITGQSVVSETWCKIMGMPTFGDQLDTQALFLSRIHPDDLPKLQAADAACIAGETSRSTAEYRIKFDDDSWRWMRSDAVVIERDDAGKALSLVGTQSDVTELRHAHNAVEASEERFRVVLAEAPVGMALMTASGKLIGVNGALSEITGYSEREMMVACYLGQFMHRDEVVGIYKAVGSMLEKGKVKAYQAEHRVIHRSGSERWGLFNITWTYDKNAGENVFIAQINDITDKKRLEQIKSEFVSTVSHELRTPLTSIKGALGLISAGSDANLSAGTQRLLEIAKTNADRLTTIVNDILDLEKISSGDVAFDFDDYSLPEIVEASVQEMMPFAVTHHNKLIVELPDDDVMVCVDPGRTRQVLANLISNACKYSDTKSNITVRVERLGDVAIVYVQNVGSGVPESFRPRIFQAFSQADGSDTRAKGGTGLGLNITRQIVERQGGEVGFESIPDSVTVFWFTCVLSKELAKPALPIERVTPTLNPARLRVMHLEDDRDFAEVIRTGLGGIADIVNVTNLATARETIRALRGELDVVILDWSLPDGDARALLDEISDAQPRARILGLSADGSRVRDARVATDMVKSRTELSTIVACVTGATAKAS